MSICPAGWVCQAERAPGSKATNPAVADIPGLPANNGVTVTAPMKLNADPFTAGLVASAETSICSALAGATVKIANVIAAANVVFIVASFMPAVDRERSHYLE
jgi:hypothetical protein